MKKYRVLIFFMICIIIVGTILSGTIIFRYDRHGDDVVFLNDIVQTAENYIDTPEKLKDYNFGVDYAIISEGKILCSSVPTDVHSVTDAIKNRYPYMMITENGYIKGFAVILSSPEEALQNQKKKAFMIFLSVEGVILACVMGWGIYVKKRIIKPFEKMEKFAGEIASGNLDIPLDMEKENMFGVFTESFDIMREELSASREREIQLKKREKELIASLSHDLKTPITGIKLTAELMQAQTFEPATLEKLDNIRKKAEQIDALVNDLFTSALKDLGEIKVNTEEKISVVLHEFVMRCDDKKLIREGVIPECLISIDSLRMEQIISNIISNSYKYAGTQIIIDYSISGNFLKMSIRDYGAGVADDELDLLTNKFYRGRASSESKAEGSGLGLYIAKTLIEKMGGEIRCLNAEPGFEVWLFIPLA